MPGLFSKIASGEVPSHKVAEDKDHLAFLDISPLAEGHLLVIPKKETDYLFDLPQSEYNALFEFTHKVAKALKNAIPCRKIGLTVIGLEVPHVHIHLVPINNVSDMSFDREKMKPSDQQLRDTAALIRSKMPADIFIQ